MFIHCTQCAVKVHLPNGRYVIEVSLPARKRRAIKNSIDGPILGWETVNEPERKVTAITVANFRFKRFYRMSYYRDPKTLERKYCLAPCVTR